MAYKPVSELSKEELRLEAAATLRALLHETRVLGSLKKRMAELEPPLLDGPRAMSKGEGIPLEAGGVLKRFKPESGRTFVVKEEVDKDAGELPAELRPIKDKEIKAMLSNLPEAVGAELLMLAEEGDDDEAPVVVTDKAKYPTVGKLREAFGETNRYIAKPPKPEHVVIEFEGFSEDKPIILSVDGIAEPK